MVTKTRDKRIEKRENGLKYILEIQYEIKITMETFEFEGMQSAAIHIS